MSVLKAMDAMNAYAGVANAGAGAGGAAKAGLAKGPSFESLLKETVTSVNAAAQQSERASVAGLNKEMDLVDVVTAVSNAEMVVETVVTVRDKVIAAYQEIMRMPI